MAGRKLRFDTAHTVAVPRPRGGMSEPEKTVTPTDPTSAENAETPDSRHSLSGPSSDSQRSDGDGDRPEADSSNDLQQLVQQTLDSQPAVNFTSLEIRHIEGGICLEGVLETNDELPDIEHLVRRVAGVDRILNRLIVRQLHEPDD